MHLAELAASFFNVSILFLFFFKANISGEEEETKYFSCLSDF